MKKIIAMLCVVCVMIGCLGVGASAYGGTYTLGYNDYASNNVYLEKGQTVSIYVEMKTSTQLNANTFSHYTDNLPETKFRLKVTGNSWNSGSLNKTFKMDKQWVTYGSNESVMYTFKAKKSGNFNITLQNISSVPNGRTYVKKPVVSMSVY